MRQQQMYGWILAIGVLCAMAVEGCSPSLPAVDTSTPAGLRREQGRTLLLDRCAICHGLEAPDSRDSAGWASVLDRMAPLAGLDSVQKALVLDYLAGAARRGSGQ